MALPIRTTLDDVKDVCGYLAKKPTGATIKDAKAVLDSKRLDARKLSAMRTWGLITEEEGRLKLTESGRRLSRNELTQVLCEVIQSIQPYSAIVERSHHQNEKVFTTIDVAAHWHEHFGESVSNSDTILNDQAVCFFQIAQGAELGTMVVGRKGSPTRFEFHSESVSAFVDGDMHPTTSYTPTESHDVFDDNTARAHTAEKRDNTPSGSETTGQGIFIAHGRNKKPLQQLKGILDQFKVPYKVATDEPNLGRPISEKVRETMRSCNCAILIFTADEELMDKDGKTIWRPSENVVHELGAAGYLYGNRIVIMKEDDVSFPSNFSDLGYISFSKDQLEAKTMDVLKELIGFGIVKVST